MSDYSGMAIFGVMTVVGLLAIVELAGWTLQWLEPVLMAFTFVIALVMVILGTVGFVVNLFNE